MSRLYEKLSVSFTLSYKGDKDRDTKVRDRGKNTYTDTDTDTDTYTDTDTSKCWTLASGQDNSHKQDQQKKSAIIASQWSSFPHRERGENSWLMLASPSIQGKERTSTLRIRLCEKQADMVYLA